MRIGILTFYREINFGANLQGLSTYFYLKKNGHTPIFIRYESIEKERAYAPMYQKESQPKCHGEFIDNFGIEQTDICHNSNEINHVIYKHNIEAIIVGSDAVAQHQTLFSQFVFSKRRLVRRKIVFPEQRFPNPFWGCGIVSNVKMAMMSVSNQDSPFMHFSPSIKKKMRIALERFSYLSVRDKWTRDMFLTILGEQNLVKVNLTPDPVFHLNQNLEGIIPTEESIRNKYSLKKKYVLISLHDQCLSMELLQGLKENFSSYNIICVALPMPEGYGFRHPFEYEIPIPLSPLDWYALIKYSEGYIGNNMHPIVSSLHNAVPCYAIDIYGTRNFWGLPQKETSSKVLDIMSRFGVENNHKIVVNGKCNASPEEIVKGIVEFPRKEVFDKSKEMSCEYQRMMSQILKFISK